MTEVNRYRKALEEINGLIQSTLDDFEEDSIDQQLEFSKQIGMNILDIINKAKEKEMFDLFEEILGIFCFIFLIIIFLVGLCFLGYTTINGTLYLLDKSECVATVAGNVVYNGRCHFISVHSIGENGNSKVLTIYNDIFGFKPKARYVNQDIEVSND